MFDSVKELIDHVVKKFKEHEKRLVTLEEHLHKKDEVTLPETPKKQSIFEEIKFK